MAGTFRPLAVKGWASCPHRSSCRENMHPSYLWSLRPLVLTAALVACGAAQADDASRITLTEENDSIVFPTDRYYTQGFEFAYLGGDVAGDSAWAKPFAGFSSHRSVRHAGIRRRVSRRYQVIFGQSIFTPDEIHTRQSRSRRPALCRLDLWRHRASCRTPTGGGWINFEIAARHRRPRRAGEAGAERLASVHRRQRRRWLGPSDP